MATQARSRRGTNPRQTRRQRQRMEAYLDVYAATGSSLTASEETGLSRGTIGAWLRAEEPTENEAWFAVQYARIRDTWAVRRRVVHGEKRGKKGWFGLV